MEILHNKILQQRIIFRRVIQLFIVIGIFLMAVTSINNENDIFWQIRMGEDIFKYHYFPTLDPYSLPAYHQVWTLHEWIPSVLFYLFFTYLGPAGLILFKAFLVALTFALFFLLFNKMKVNLYLSIFVLTLAALVNTRGIWVVFPSIFEYLFVVLTLFLLEIYRTKKTPYIPLFLIALAFFWANAHASFFLLTFISLFYLVGDFIAQKLKKRFIWYEPKGLPFRRKQYLWLGAIGVSSVISPFLTPNGIWTFLYPFRIQFGSFTSYVSEYQKLWTVWHWDFTDIVHGFTVLLIFVLVLIFLFSYKRLHPTDLLLGILFTGLAVSAVRHVAVFALVALYLICRYITVWFGEYRGIVKRSLIKDISLLLIIICFVIFYKTKLVPFGLGLSEDGYPKAEAEIVNSKHVKGNMFNHYNYGGYLIWRMPEYKVFIDGRLEMYEGKAGRDYLTILEARPGYERLLEKYHITFFIEYFRDPIIEALMASKQWRYIYSDDQFVLLVKDTPENKTFLAQNWSKQKEESFRKAYTKALAEYKGTYFNDMGVQALQKGDIIGGISAFQEAVKYNPGFVIARLNLAQADSNYGLLTEAYKEYQTILYIDPNNELAKKNMLVIERMLKH